MVTTSNPQDGAPSSLPPNPPAQPEQLPTVADNSNSVSSSDPPSDPPAVPESPLRHPAPLPPQPPITNSDPSWKRRPPKVVIRIDKVDVGVVVSWKLLLTPNHEEISKYEVYSYQEGSYPPSTSLWKKLGDLDPYPLPMGCTVSQLSAGYTYHFAVRAVDIHGRCGKFSESLSMYMEEDKVADELLVKEEGKARTENEAEAASKKDSNGEGVGSVQGKEGECEVSAEKDSEEKSVGLPRDPASPVKEIDKTVACDVDGEKATGQFKEQDKEAAQGKDQDYAKAQAKEQDKEMLPVKEEKDSSPCSC